MKKSMKCIVFFDLLLHTHLLSLVCVLSLVKILFITNYLLDMKEILCVSTCSDEN